MSNAETFQEWAKEILPIVKAAANGEPIEVMNSGKWVDKAKHIGFDMHDVYRIKPKTIRIGEYNIPEPMREMPVSGTDYYIADVVAQSLHGVCTWSGDAHDIAWFNRGIVHSTKDAAVRHSMALLSLTKAVSNVHPR